MKPVVLMAAIMSLYAAPCAFAQDAASPPAESKAPGADDAKAPKTSAEQTEALYDRLAKTEDSDEAAGIEAALGRLRMQSGSDTSDLLMSRAEAAMAAKNYTLSLSLLGTIVDLQPEWAEGWNKRATVRYFAGDPKGSMADIAQTLKREPRHLGALAGMGAILEESGLNEDALRTYMRALEIAPHYKPMLDAVERVKAALAGQAL
jgi:tetratricopeptide (TPR) repeat protein